MFKKLILTSKLLIKKDKFSELELVLHLRELWSAYLIKIRGVEQCGSQLIYYGTQDCQKFKESLTVKEILKQLKISPNNIVLNKLDPGSLFTQNEKLQNILTKNNYICLSPIQKNRKRLQKTFSIVDSKIPTLYKISHNDKLDTICIGNKFNTLNILKINRSPSKHTYYDISKGVQYADTYNTFDPSQIFELYIQALIKNHKCESELETAIQNSNIYEFLNAHTKDHLHNLLIHNLLMLSENIIVPVEYRETIQNLFIEQWFDIETAKKIKLAITLNSTEDIIKMLITNKLKNENTAYNIPLLDMDIL